MAPGITVLVAGIGGRTGRAVAAQAAATPGVTLAGGIVRPDSPDAGRDIGELAGIDPVGLAAGTACGPLSVFPAAAGADVLIDFTAPVPAVELARIAASRGIALVTGTTGFTKEQEEAFSLAVRGIPVVRSGNMSPGINMMVAMAKEMASALDDSFDIEISETHHRYKADAPSGTALMLGEAVAEGRGVSLSGRTAGAENGRSGVRNRGDIGFSVSRGGGVIGDHGVSFISSDEVLTVSHRALGRTLFARGAVYAAQWVVRASPGIYSMQDVLRREKRS